MGKNPDLQQGEKLKGEKRRQNHPAVRITKKKKQLGPVPQRTVHSMDGEEGQKKAVREAYQINKHPRKKDGKRLLSDS